MRVCLFAELVLFNSEKSVKKRTQALFGWFLWFCDVAVAATMAKRCCLGVFVFSNLFMQREDKHNDDYDSVHTLVGDH